MGGVKLEDLPDKLRAQAEEQLGLALGGKVSGKAPKPKRDPHETLADNSQTPLIGERVYLVVLMYRCEGIEWDLDNASFKPVLDALVQRGVLEDDSIKYIEGLIKLPRKCKRKEEERTELEFWSADYFEPYIESARRKRKETT